MKIQFSAEQEAQLSQIALHQGTDLMHLVKDAALRLLSEDQQYRAVVREGVAAADGGAFVSHEEVWAGVEEALHP